MSDPMAAWRLSYTDGSWLALAGPTSLVIMMAPPAEMSPLVEDLWQGTLRTNSPDALFRFVADAGIATMPHFGAFFFDDDGLHGLTRGDVRVVDAATGEVVIDGSGAVTWAEEQLDLQRTYAVRLETTADDAPRLPLAVGAATVSSVTLTTAPDQLLRFPTAEEATAPAAVPERAAEPEPAPQPAPEPEPTPDHSTDDMPAVEADGDTEPAPHTQPFDPAALDEVPSASSPQSADEPMIPPAMHRPVVPPTPSAPPPEARPAPVVVPGSFGEVDDDPGTIFSTGIAATHKPPAEDGLDQQVLAAPCAQGHPNPAGARTCRLCHAPVDSSNPRLVRRPVLAGVNTNHGEFTDLLGSVIIGRSPDGSHGPGGAYLMRVPSPANDISRSHLKISTKEWNIVVTDLHSTNGTTVRPPGEPEFELRDGRSVTVEIGTILDLGDGVALRIEPPRSG